MNKLPSGWQIKSLGEVTLINPTFNKVTTPSDKVTFVPMAAVDENTGRIEKPQTRKHSEVSIGFTNFCEGDILFAKITPCMENGKCAVALNLKNGLGFGSTEFHVLRCSQLVNNKYLFYFLWRKSFRQVASKNMTGSAGQKRVPKRFLETVKIPLPPLQIQKQIAEILEKADQAKQKRKEANQLTEQFLQSAFIEMFGDPVKNPKGWESEKFENLGKLARGKSKHRPRNAPFLLGGKYPLIQTGEIVNSFIYIKNFAQTYSEEGLKQSKLWPKGTLCISIAANIGFTAILNFEACFPDSIVGFTPNAKVLSEYIHFYFRLIQKRLEDDAPQSAQKNINLEILNKLKVSVPPLPLQQQFADLVQKTETLKEKQKASEQELENLFNSLMQKKRLRESW